MTGGLLTGAATITKYHRKFRLQLKWLDYPFVHGALKYLPSSLLIITIFIASFQAFDDEYLARLRAEKSKNEALVELAAHSSSGQEHEIAELKIKLAEVEKESSESNEKLKNALIFTTGKPERHLSDKTKKELAEQLKSISPLFTNFHIVKFIGSTPESESFIYLKDFAEALQNAGFKNANQVESVDFELGTKPEESYGIIILVKDPKHPSDLAKKFADIIRQFDPKISFQDFTGADDNYIGLLIGYNR